MAGVRRDSGRDPREMVDERIAEAVALAFVFLTGNGVRERGVHGRSSRLQLHFDLLASPKVLTAPTTLVALLAIAATWVADGLAGSAVTALWSAVTDDFTALVWLGKSLLAELTSDVASLWIFVTCDFRPLMSPPEAALVSPLTEFSGSLRSEQYPGLLLPPQPVSATSATAPNITTFTRSHARHGPSRDLSLASCAHQTGRTRSTPS